MIRDSSFRFTAKDKCRAVDEHPSGHTSYAFQPRSDGTIKTESKGEENTAPDGVDTAMTPSNTDSVTEVSDDPLMAGDYRPLKSVLKSKKKPRQLKNIHHNYFLHMRGWRPHFVPFPHGYHPKPHDPRNSLWWDNVPKSVDHIMAPPAILKAPEELKEDELKVDDALPRDKNGDGASEGDANSTGKGDNPSAESMKTERAKSDSAEDQVKVIQSKHETAKEAAASALPTKDDNDKVVSRERSKTTKDDKATPRSVDKEKERARMKAEVEAKRNAKIKPDDGDMAKPTDRARTGKASQLIPVDPQVYV